MSESDDPCPGCGNYHDVPFSPELLDLYQRFRAAETKEEREMLAMQIADSFLSGEYDNTDFSAYEEYHSFFTEYEKAQLEMKHAALKAARVAVHIIDEYHNAHGVPEAVQERDHSSN